MNAQRKINPPCEKCGTEVDELSDHSGGWQECEACGHVQNLRLTPGGPPGRWTPRPSLRERLWRLWRRVWLCPNCEGKGETFYSYPTDYGTEWDSYVCEYCCGFGRRISRCPERRLLGPKVRALVTEREER